MNILKRRYADLFDGRKESVAGEYELVVRKADGRVKQRIKFNNLLTTAGLDTWVGTTSPPIERLGIGTGTAPPAFSDTMFANYKADTSVSNNGEVNSGAPDYISTKTWYARFEIGMATGNITEVGLGRAVGGPFPTHHRLFSRALITDSGGTPVTITVLADEYLDVYYYLKYYPDLTDKVYNIDISGTTYTVTQRPYHVGQNSKFSSSIGLANIRLCSSAFISTSATLVSNTTAEGSSVWVPSMDVTNDSYVAGSFIKSGYTEMPTSTGTMSIRSIFLQDVSNQLGVWQRQQLSFSAAIPKTNLNVLRLHQQRQILRYTP